MTFDLYSKCYDLLYKDKPYEEEAEYVFNSLTRRNSSIQKVLELGCGSGNHAYWLAQRGWIITGIEKSESMVALAEAKHIEGFRPKQGDITGFKLETKFDAAISLFHVISYLNTNEEVLNCFSNVNRHLVDGGLFLFDVWFTPGVYSQCPETRIKRLSDGKTEIIRLAESEMHFDTNVVDVHYQILAKGMDGKCLQFEELHKMRHFSAPEIELFASQKGFKVVETEEFVTRNKPSVKTWAICFTLKKIKDV